METKEQGGANQQYADDLSPDQPEMSHRMLTEAEVRVIWKAFRSATLPHQLQEIRIVLQPENGRPARGWMFQIAHSQPLTSAVAHGGDQTKLGAWRTVIDAIFSRFSVAKQW